MNELTIDNVKWTSPTQGERPMETKIQYNTCTWEQPETKQWIYFHSWYEKKF